VPIRKFSFYMNKEVWIVGAARTPIGSFNGALASLAAPRLGAVAIKKAMEMAGVGHNQVDELFMGNVISANIGQAPATQAGIYAGIHPETPFTTINKVCASGMKAMMLGAQAIELGHAEVVVAGGMESMSQIPYYLDQYRNGGRLGHGQVVDGILRDGLTDVYHQYHMGNAAELCASEYKITREEQDDYAIRSYQRSAQAWSEGKFAAEIAPVSVEVRGKDPMVVDTDEDYTKVNFDKIGSLRPVFDKNGTITAANASNLNDGASAVVLMCRERAEQMGVRPLARILGYADAQQAPEWFTTAPAKAIPRAMKRAGIAAAEVDFYEINEAFSVVCIANNRLLSLDPARVNVYGGGVSLGHPIGSSGCRIVVTLAHLLRQEGGRVGVAGICNGGGGASAMVIERI